MDQLPGNTRLLYEGLVCCNGLSKRLLYRVVGLVFLRPAMPLEMNGLLLEGSLTIFISLATRS